MLRRLAYWSWVLVLFLPGLVGAAETEEPAANGPRDVAIQQVETACPQVTNAQELPTDPAPASPFLALPWQQEAGVAGIDWSRHVLDGADTTAMAPGRCRLTCQFCWTSSDCPLINGRQQLCQAFCL